MAEEFQHILNLHRTQFPSATRPVAPSPPLPDRDRLYGDYAKRALAGISVFRRARRVRVRQLAMAWADAEMARQRAAGQMQQAAWQRQLDQWWQRLCTNDPETVVKTLAEAFEDNEAPASVVGVINSEVSLVVLVPGAGQVVPERMPTTTAAGNLSLKKLTQRERADFYKLFVCGQILVTVREALAVAPGIAAARVVAVRDDGPDAYGRPCLVCLAAVRLDRSALTGVQWESADAVTIINQVASERVINQRGRSGDLHPLDLSHEPSLASVIDAIDLSDLVAEIPPGSQNRARIQ